MELRPLDRRLVWALTLLIALSVSCGRVLGQSPVGGNEEPFDDASFSGPPVNWDSPLPAGIQIPDASAASLAFDPNVPDELPTPIAIFATDPAHAPLALREIAWVFGKDMDSRFVVRERIVSVTSTQREYAELAALPSGCVEEPDGGMACYPTDYSVAAVRGGDDCSSGRGRNCNGGLVDRADPRPRLQGHRPALRGVPNSRTRSNGHGAGGLLHSW